MASRASERATIVVLAACVSVLPGPTSATQVALRPMADSQTSTGDAVSPRTALVPEPSWSVQGSAGSDLGRAVASAGDVNGDGFGDIFVGVPLQDDATTGGAAYVYYGSATGPSLTPDWSADAGEPGALFGNSGGAAGDVNDDGFDDVIVGAPALTSSGVTTGGALVYLGSVTGLSSTPSWVVFGQSSNDRFGWSVHAAGDVDDDGFDDVIVGARLADATQFGNGNQGKAYVYRGSAGGLSTSAVWSYTGSSIPGLLGSSVGTAGDVDGDGFDDVIVGEPRYSNGEPGEGRALVFRGSISGPLLSASWSAEGNSVDARFGSAVSGAGDVNGDGFDDVLVGSQRFTNGESEEGAAAVFLARFNGILSPTPNWMVEGETADLNFGGWVAPAGDVDSDGFDDILIGSKILEVTDPVRAALYRGSTAGPIDHAEWWALDGQSVAVGGNVGAAGDVDGDGNPDILVGQRSYSGNGAAFLYTDGPCVDGDADGTCSAFDCDDVNPHCLALCDDLDGDGFCADVDCNDTDPQCSADCGDPDFDQVCNDVDNCPLTQNFDQADLDGDGLGDRCDACPPVPGVGVDTDGDGLCDTADGCPLDPDWTGGQNSKVSAGGPVTEYELSRNGTRVAYLSRQGGGILELYGVPVPGGASTRLNDDVETTGVEWFRIAGDTGLVAYEADQLSGGEQLYSVPIDGGTPTGILDIEYWLPRVTGDGDFVVTRCRYYFENLPEGFQLCSVPITGGPVSTFAEPNIDFYYYVEPVGFSPIGNSVAIPHFREHEIGTFPYFVDMTSLDGYSGVSFDNYVPDDYKWTTDGNWFLYKRLSWVGGGQQSEILWGRRLGAGSSVQLSDTAGIYEYDITPVEVEGSERVVYSRYAGADLYQRSVDGGSEVLLSSSVRNFKISPDGLHVVYDDVATSPEVDLYSLPILGGTPIRLTPVPVAGGNVIDYAIMPDGQWVVYRADQDVAGQIDLYAVPIGGGTPHKLNVPSTGAHQVSATYLLTPDSSQVIYLTDGMFQGPDQLFKVPVAGGTAQRVNGNPFRSVRDNVSMSSDGRFVLYLSDEDVRDRVELYAHDLDLDGDSVPAVCDCDPLDGALWSTPGTVPGLTLDHVDGVGGTTALSWDEPTDRGGLTLLYDALRSTSPDGYAPGGAGFEVLEGDLSERNATDGDDPSPGFYYRIRAKNGCGDGPT